MRILFSLFLNIILFSSEIISQGYEENYRLIGSCEGCEAVFEYDDQNLTNTDTLPDFEETDDKLILSGTIYKKDGKTPADNVILYIYHTNGKGIYPVKGNEYGWGKRHGYLRGWIKTDKDGRYTFFSSKPGNYPNSRTPAHIHAILLEPDGKYYWISDFYFADDPYLNDDELPDNPRGGTGGILKLVKKGDLKSGERDIILGKNIPGYE